MTTRRILRCAVGMVLVAGLLALLSPGVGVAQTVTLKFGDIYAETHSNSKGAFKFAELVSQKTKGQVKIDVFVDSKLGNEREMAESVVAGSIDMVASGLSGIGRFIQPIHTLELPYIYRDLDHMNRVAETLAPDVDKILRKSGLRNLGFFYLGPRSIAGKRPIRSLEDMRGLRFRVPEAPLYVGMARALGATPTPVAFPEAYTSLGGRGRAGDSLEHQVVRAGQVRQPDGAHLALPVPGDQREILPEPVSRPAAGAAGSGQGGQRVSARPRAGVQQGVPGEDAGGRRHHRDHRRHPAVRQGAREVQPGVRRETGPGGSGPAGKGHVGQVGRVARPPVGPTIRSRSMSGWRLNGGGRLRRRRDRR
ncbi:MAG: TRAP transporter substrate-binding protein [candidate division NC10 bacterium]|nr:TRAP transporter substrate-binding protein [candidate division NC10 bacterium]